MTSKPTSNLDTPTYCVKDNNKKFIRGKFYEPDLVKIIVQSATRT